MVVLQHKIGVLYMSTINVKNRTKYDFKTKLK